MAYRFSLMCNLLVPGVEVTYGCEVKCSDPKQFIVVPDLNPQLFIVHKEVRRIKCLAFQTVGFVEVLPEW